MEAMIAALAERVRRIRTIMKAGSSSASCCATPAASARPSRPSAAPASSRPDNADYLAYRGEILLVMARSDEVPPEAERLFRRVLELEPDNPQARFYLATIRDIAASIAARSTT